MGSSDSDEHPPSRKRTRANGANEDAPGNGKKQRGRPRVDTQDETAADRRRTQIRLAQRAYRQRKETTISGLKARVSELESAIDSMNQAFLRFNDSAMSSGLLNMKPDLARELKKTTETFVQLARDAAKNSEPEDDDPDDDVEEVVPERALVKKNTRSTPKPTRQSPESNRDQQLDIGWGYTQMFETQHQQDARNSQEMQMASFLSSLPTRDSQSLPTMLPFGLIDPLDDSSSNASYQQYNIQVPSPRLPLDHPVPELSKVTTICPPYTYSFQEPTFARRLQRAAIERGFHLLSTSRERPATFNHVFKLALLSQSREQIIARFRTILTKSNVESLDYWQTPYIHLGGAGTHYPQRDGNGAVIPKPNGWTVRGIGPWSPKIRFVSNTGSIRDMDIDLRGFEGEWFDPHDVQGYLESKGCIINPDSSFAEAWIDMAPASTIEGFGSPLAMDLGMSMGFPAMEPSSFFPQASSAATATGSVTPVSGALSSSRSSSGSESMVTGTSTPPTPNNLSLSDLGFDLTGIPPADMFPGLELPSTTTDNTENNTISPFDPALNTATGKSSPSAFYTLADKPSIPQHPLSTEAHLRETYTFDTGGLYNGNGTDLDNMFDILSPKSEMARQQKRLVTVDVNKLIDELTRRGVCLGRSPGFRRADVDKAFNASVIHAF